MIATPCECPVAGYCERHKRMKAGRLHELCRTDMRYFDMWDRQSMDNPSPRQDKYKKEHERRSTWVNRLSRYRLESDRGVGDVVERLAAKAGGRFIKRAAAVLGISCGCQDRQKWLNEQYPFR